MRYFVRRLGGEVSILFRVLPEVAVEIYDPAAHAWRPRALEPLYRWAVVEPGLGRVRRQVGRDELGSSGSALMKRTADGTWRKKSAR